MSLGSAIAADLPVKARPMMMEAAYDWSGFYVGGELGGIWDRASGSFVAPPPASYTNRASTGIGGGFVGYQYQWNQVVLGVEADVIGLFNQDLGRSACTPVAGCIAGLTIGNRMGGALWSVGPRLGWAAGQWMPYVTGGYAGTRVSNTAFAASGAVTEQFSQDRSGYYVGAGVDWAFNPNWIVGVEYRHDDFGTTRSVPLGVAGVPVTADTTDLSLRSDQVTARISYKFGGPIGARY
ncbi:outer membrane protein [Bradyrhizobium sp.]|uniref:outer membrane protein n=1 Tax=Bradyrhizobium sp. TaxID=376 RepID=UPI003C5B807C